MGGLCSKSKGEEDLDASRHVVATAATLSASTTKKIRTDASTAKKTMTKTTEGNEKSGDYLYKSSADDADDELFFDAFQSFKDLKSINYPPATKMFHSRLSNQISIEKEPESLLLHPDQSTSQSSSSSSPTNTTKTTEQKRDSTIAIRDSLRDHTNITTHGYPGELDEEELNACIKFREELKKRDPAYREMVLAYSPAEGTYHHIYIYIHIYALNEYTIIFILGLPIHVSPQTSETTI